MGTLKLWVRSAIIAGALILLGACGSITGTQQGEGRSGDDQEEIVAVVVNESTWAVDVYASRDHLPRWSVRVGPEQGRAFEFPEAVAAEGPLRFVFFLDIMDPTDIPEGGYLGLWSPSVDLGPGDTVRIVTDLPLENSTFDFKQ